jgi:hypothetical protein
VYTWDFLVGITVFLGIRTFIIPPATSIPRERGATSKRTQELRVSFPAPVKIAAWTAAP